MSESQEPSPVLKSSGTVLIVPEHDSSHCGLARVLYIGISSENRRALAGIDLSDN